MASRDYDHLFEACRELFGPEIETGPEFLHYLQSSGIKSAFRRKAKETHPEHFAQKPLHLQDLHAAEFCRVKSAYEALSLFVSQREQSAAGARRSQAWPRYRQPSGKSAGGEYGSASVPGRVLQLGRYLYYRKVISFVELLQAISWQRSCRGPVGLIAREWGWMSAADVFAVVSAEMPGRFGEKAIKLGMLNSVRLKMILVEQKLRHRRIGQYFLQSKMLTSGELDGYLRDLRLHNSRFGKF
jgi:hypothetical protein